MAKTNKNAKSKVNSLPLWDDYINEHFKKNNDEAMEFIKYSFDEFDNNGDSKLLMESLKLVADAIGIPTLAKRTGMPKQSIYKALSEQGNPRLNTLAALLKGMGLQLSCKPQQRAA